MMIKESEGSIVGLSEASTAVTESNEYEKRIKRSDPRFYLRTHQVHGVEDRPNFLTVCKNKYGVDYPKE